MRERETSESESSPILNRYGRDTVSKEDLIPMEPIFENRAGDISDAFDPWMGGSLKDKVVPTELSCRDGFSWDTGISTKPLIKRSGR